MKHINLTISLATLMTGILVGVGLVPALSGHAGNGASITEGAKVTIAITMTVPDSDLKFPEKVSEYVAGQHETLPSIEASLTGMKSGEHKRVDLQAGEAFGPYDPKKRTTVRRDQLPADVAAGSIYQTPEGQPFTITALSDTAAEVDLNHPLAGKPLVLDVEILKVEQGS
jgi:FKBP-type peptidyl-prolyl cis-trans isomerase 2